MCKDKNISEKVLKYLVIPMSPLWRTSARLRYTVAPLHEAAATLRYLVAPPATDHRTPATPSRTPVRHLRNLATGCRTSCTKISAENTLRNAYDIISTAINKLNYLISKC